MLLQVTAHWHDSSSGSFGTSKRTSKRSCGHKGSSCIVGKPEVIVAGEMGRFSGDHLSSNLRGILGIAKWRQPTRLKLALMGRCRNGAFVPFSQEEWWGDAISP